MAGIIYVSVNVNLGSEKFLVFFYGLAACSWMPHWACHYYRLETRSTFIVGKWKFSVRHSVLSLLVYSFLIAMNLVAIGFGEYRVFSATISGLGHLSIGLLHLYRLWRPFHFEVFGYEWSHGASLREVAIIIPFGLLCLVVAASLRF